MKKWAIRIGAFVLSIVLGVGTSSLWNSNPLISLCDIDANPERYAGVVRLQVMVFKDVHIKAGVERRRFITACSVCAGSEHLTFASVDLDKQQLGILPEENHIWHEEHVSETERTYATEAILVGHFEPPVGSTGCFGPKYHISEARIERVIANHEFQNHEQRTQWLKSISR